MCDSVQLSEGQLPTAFEGEERSVAGVGDVLQLVSGRQLLGVVRERQDACLPGPITLTSQCNHSCHHNVNVQISTCKIATAV